MEDEAILDLYWVRNEDAVGETEKKYGRYCAAIARNILCDREDEEECLSDTWLGAWNSIPPQRPRIFSAYLGRITRNLSLNIISRRSAKKRGENFSVAFEELSECIPAKENTGEKAEYSGLVSFLNVFLRELPKDERYVFLRRYWYCDPIKEISEASGFSESKIKSMLFRTRKQLKKLLEKEGYLL